MARKKKTREQKILAEIRRRQQLLEGDKASLDTASKTKHHEQKQNIVIPAEYTIRDKNKPVITDSYKYLKRDLTKTTLITFAIVIIQFILYYILL